MNDLQTAFLALRNYLDRADTSGVSVVIQFPSQQEQHKFERLTRHDGLGYMHRAPRGGEDLSAVAPRETLPRDVDLQIAGIDIKYESPPSPPIYHPSRHRRD